MVISVRLRAPFEMKQLFGRKNSPQRPLPPASSIHTGHDRSRARAAHIAVHAGGNEGLRQRWTEQKTIDAEPGVPASPATAVSMVPV
jgi:hypothetical protein